MEIDKIIDKLKASSKDKFSNRWYQTKKARSFPYAVTNG